MKKLDFAVLVVIFATALVAAPRPDHVPGRLLVQHRTGTDPTVVARILAIVGAKKEKMIPQLNVSVLQVPEAASDQVSAALAQTGLFNFVEGDYIAHVFQSPTQVDPNDPDFALQWHLNKIQGPYAWGVTKGTSTVTIAVIDSGADSTQPDLAPKLVPGWNFLNGTSNTADDYGHGTAVAGTAAAATDNSTGVAGVAWSNMIMPLLVVDSTGSASDSNIASAITYAADHGARVINMSLGGPGASSTLQSAVDYAWNKGVVIIAAAGNSGNSTMNYPAACTNVVAVSATDQNENLAGFSSYGSWIDLSAPGTSILTTMNGGGYGYVDGTSFASPVVAGVAALVISLKPSLSNSAVVTLLEQNSDDLGSPGPDQYFGYGRVNAYKAVLAATSSTDTTPPSVSFSNPITGSTVSGTIPVRGTATDNVGVANIQFYVGTQLVASTSTSPFSFSWNTTAVANGSYSLTVKAYDAAGNVGSASVTVTVNNPVPIDTKPPTVAITKPANGATVSGNVQISVSATDNVAVAQVSVYLDSVLRCTDTTAPYTCAWNTKKAASGTHVITATAWDRAGNAGYATPVTVTK